MSKARRYLFDVNVLVALLDEDHIHHHAATEWFDRPGLRWAVCPFTEAGFLRYMTSPKTGGMSVEEASAMLTRLGQVPGYYYQPVSLNWHTLCSPLLKRIFGHNQVTDAYLLGLAVHEGLILVTFDKAITHLAAKHQSHLLLLTETAVR